LTGNVLATFILTNTQSGGETLIAKFNPARGRADAVKASAAATATIATPVLRFPPAQYSFAR
jgi:hypothetical protein